MMTDKETSATNTHDSFETMVLKFLNYSNASTFYLFSSLALFIATMSLYQVILFDKGFENAQIILTLTASTLIGLLFWRSAVNRFNYKPILKDLLAKVDVENNDKGTETLMEALKAQKKTVLHKLRSARLWMGVLVGFMVIYLSQILAATAQTENPDYLNNSTLYFIVMIVLGSIVLTVITLAINKRFNKEVTKIS